MKKLHLVHYGPGPTSITAELVAQLRPVLAGKFIVDELDLVVEQPILFDKQSMAAYVKRNYLKQDLSDLETLTLAIPDVFTDKVLATDILVVIVPMYNFQVAAAVKAWIDNITQSGKLFRYTEYGPEGLSNIEKAIIIPITGSTPANSARDFLTPYMDFMMKFIGAKQVEFHGIYGSKYLGDERDTKIAAVVEEVMSSLAN